MGTALYLICDSEHKSMIEKLQIFQIQGPDKRRRVELRIIGKFFPDSSLDRFPRSNRKEQRHRPGHRPPISASVSILIIFVYALLLSPFVLIVIHSFIPK